MPLYIAATPIGHAEDITIRARRLLMESAIIIGEERPETERFLKRLGRYPFPQIETLNEHSTTSDVQDLKELCRNQDVVLISDCGTPGFCDPGVELSSACRAAGIRVIPVPGASSLMALLSVVGARFSEFHFAGFPPREEQTRRAWIARLISAPHASVAMDTPYRLEKFIAELAATAPDRRALLGIDLTLETERIEEDRLSQLAKKIPTGLRGEFILCLYPDANAARATKNSTSAQVLTPGSSSNEKTNVQDRGRERKDQAPKAGARRYSQADPRSRRR